MDDENDNDISSLYVNVKRDNKVSFSYEDGYNTFQRGELGLSYSYLVGNLNYNGANMISSVDFHFKGIEQAQHIEMGERTIINQNNTHVLIEKHSKVNFKEPKQIKTYYFKFLLPSNLSSSFHIADKHNNVIGQIIYTLHATVHTTAKFRGQRESVEIKCPLEQILFRNYITYKTVEGTHNDLKRREPLFRYSFQIPEYLSLGETVSVPIKITFINTGVKIVRIEIALKKVTEIRFEKDGTSFKNKLKCCAALIQPAQITNNELCQKLSLSTPRNLHTSHSGMFINIQYRLCINFLLTGIENTDSDFYKEKPVIVANIKEQDGISNSQNYRNSESDLYVSRPHSTDPIQEGYDNPNESTVQNPNDVQELSNQGHRRSLSISRTSTSSNRGNQ
ncbi:15835_t:CDS:1 [Dentiscutata erythropus]|uniref:15835_t:CDS:1 n=1 Tax=Dentiscutata erythropus TaxID=1348616 RepID=A0A9N9J2W3_9GLOM|nr:15835_t:CDS:1 [Dentiscutata erythropus]